MKVVDLPSRFYSSRNNQPVRYIVLHTTQGQDSRTWLTQTGNVSAHYLVRGDTVYRLVPEEFAAWHAGRISGTPTTPYYTGWNPNDESIGIEMEGRAAVPLDALTIATTAELIWDIRERHPVPLVDHRELSPGDRSDPGVNRALVDAALGEEEDDMTPAQEAKLDRLLAIVEAREDLVWASRGQRGLDVERGKPFDSALPPIDQRIRQ